MSVTPVTRAAVPGLPGPTGPEQRRVRQQARDAALLMGFSLAMSLACATAFLLLAGLGR